MPSLAIAPAPEQLDFLNQIYKNLSYLVWCSDFSKDWTTYFSGNDLEPLRRTSSIPSDR